jgi:putative ABC transport system permease protein
VAPARFLFRTHLRCRNRKCCVDGAGEPEHLDIERCSADLFETLGVQPALGRAFAPGEDQAGHEHVAVISDSLWRRRFLASRAILGKTIQLDSQSYTVIGILPPWFRFPGARVLEAGEASALKPEVFRPLVFSHEELQELMGTFNYAVIARLKHGITPEQSLAELNVIAAQLVKMSGEKMELRASAIPMRDSIVGKSR